MPLHDLRKPGYRFKRWCSSLLRACSLRTEMAIGRVSPRSQRGWRPRGGRADGRSGPQTKSDVCDHHDRGRRGQAAGPRPAPLMNEGTPRSGVGGCLLAFKHVRKIHCQLHRHPSPPLATSSPQQCEGRARQLRTFLAYWDAASSTPCRGGFTGPPPRPDAAPPLRQPLQRWVVAHQHPPIGGRDIWQVSGSPRPPAARKRIYGRRNFVTKA